MNHGDSIAAFRAKLHELMPADEQRELMTQGLDRLSGKLRARGFAEDALCAALLRAAIESMIARDGAPTASMMLAEFAQLIHSGQQDITH